MRKLYQGFSIKMPNSENSIQLQNVHECKRYEQKELANDVFPQPQCPMADIQLPFSLCMHSENLALINFGCLMRLTLLLLSSFPFISHFSMTESRFNETQTFIFPSAFLFVQRTLYYCLASVFPMQATQANTKSDRLPFWELFGSGCIRLQKNISRFSFVFRSEFFPFCLSLDVRQTNRVGFGLTCVYSQWIPFSSLLHHANLSPLCFLQSSNHINSYLLFHRQSPAACVPIFADSTDMLDATTFELYFCLHPFVPLCYSNVQTFLVEWKSFAVDDMHISPSSMLKYMCSRVWQHIEIWTFQLNSQTRKFISELFFAFSHEANTQN